MASSSNAQQTTRKKMTDCFICGNENGENEESLSNVTERGENTMERLLKEANNDAALERFQLNSSYHRSCKLQILNKSKSTSRKRTQEDKKEREESRIKKQRTKKVSLLYKGRCILCNELVRLYTNNPELARKTYSRPDNKSSPKLMKRLLQTAKERLIENREDAWAFEVKGRLLGINDLVAEEALLHKRCNTNFLDGCSKGGDRNVGRKKDDARLKLFEDLCLWLETKMEHCLFTLEQLHKKLLSLDPTPDKSLVYSTCHLKNMLQERYRNQLYFTSQERRKDVLCFKDLTADIIREHQENSNDDDRSKIIKTAVKLIKNDIAMVNLDSSMYPSVNEMVNLDDQLKIIPESLKLLLKPLLKSDERVAFWGQSIIRTSRPRSGVLPLPMRFALQLTHRFGSKWLVNEAHSLGFCESYHEVSMYKYCYIRSKFKSDVATSNTLDIIIEEEEEGIEDDDKVNEELQAINDQEECEFGQLDSNSSSRTMCEYNGEQYVGDNIDLNIVSINGNTAFHAMGLIKVSNRSSVVTEEYLNSKVPRLKLTSKEKADILIAGNIPIKHCKDPKKSGIDTIQLKSVQKLVESAPSSLSKPSHADSIWTAGWILNKRDKNFSHANWNGWMKGVHDSNKHDVSCIQYEPIIDGDPNDSNTIYTTLLRCIEQQKPNIPVITFDLPIWLKSLDIILARKLSIIPRLGGFHLLKSFLGTFGNIFADSGLHEMVQLIYPGELTADSILNGNSYDKAIRAHFLIDAALVQHVLPPSEFTDEELSAMEKAIHNACNNQKGIDSNGIPVAEMFQEKVRNVFEKLDDSGRTPSLFSLYHYMVDTIKIFIRAERLADFDLHLSCIINRMIYIFAAAGHHNYAKAARLYAQMMLAYDKGTSEEAAIMRSFKSDGSHVVRYSSSEWAGIWADLTIEQTLMRTSKSDGGLSGGRFRNGESAHRCWVQTLSHFSLINRLAQKVQSKNTHRDLTSAQRLLDEKAMNSISNWLDEMQPFSESIPRDVLHSFSTGFFSKEGDGINPEKALVIGRSIQKKIDGKVPSTTLEKRNKVKPLSMLRNIHGSNPITSSINAFKYFNRLIVFAQRESDLETSLGMHEMTHLPMSLFSEKDQLMHEGDKATFVQTCLKDNVMPKPVDPQEQVIDTFVIDGGWLLRQNKWEKGYRWGDIIDGYIRLVKKLGSHAKNVTVVFDGYENSTKDHTHRRRKKYFCQNMKISRANLPYTSKEKFLSNSNNKTELISILSKELNDGNIFSICCKDDADTAIVKKALESSLVGTVQIRAEDADILVMFCHHYDVEKHNLITLTTAKASYDIKDIVQSLSPEQRKCLLFCHSFSGCDTVSSVFGLSKVKLYKRICDANLSDLLSVFYDESSTVDQIENAGIGIFQFIYKSIGTPLSVQRVNRFNQQSKVGVLRPESLPPTDGAAAQHSLRAYLQLQDWLHLQSMSRDPKMYGWYITTTGRYEPILTKDEIAPPNLLKFVSCNCAGNCLTKRCSCNKNNVKCISACGTCHGNSCKNVEEEVKSANDS